MLMAETEKTVDLVKYTKEQLRKSKKYKSDVDILGVVLENGKSYTFEETDKLIKEFKERKVK